MTQGSSRTWLLAALLLCLSSPALAQSGPATVSGTIRDESGGVLVGVTVTARNLGTQAMTTVVCDERGAYAIGGLDAGNYELLAVLPGFQSMVTEFQLAAGETRTMDMTLDLAALAERITVTRGERQLSTVPKAVNVVTEEEIQFAQRRVSLSETLRGLPGVFAQHRHNFSLSGGVQLAVRAPAPRFGLRGVQILQDGIPLTTADGTTQPTNIMLGSAGRIEVLRGPSSVLYGNAAGGVINIQTEFPSDRPFVFQPDVQFGSHGYDRQQVKVQGSAGRHAYLVDLTRMQTDGYREHSAAEIRQANLMLRSKVSDRTEVRTLFNLFDMPFAESASTLNLEAARNAPDSVRQIAIDQGWGEGATQGQGGVTLEHRFEGGQLLRTTGWAMWRDLWNAVPGRIITLNRAGGGFRSEYIGAVQLGSVPVTWTTGFDASYQRDNRSEFVNEGVPTGAARALEGDLIQDQRERVFSVGPFAQVSLSPQPRWNLMAGVRYDFYDFDAGDRFLSDGDQSGGRTMSAFSPMVGVTYAAADDVNIYGNIATAYQTPTTVELSNRPSGEGGFNTNLDPEDLRSFELGVRGLVEHAKLRYGVAGYVATLDNALIPFERADEQIFFRNAGEASRNGFEVELSWEPTSSVGTHVSYTYQDFQFERFVVDGNDFAGNHEPGAPPHRVFAGVTYVAPFGLHSTADIQWIDAYPVNNDNTFENWASTVVDLRFGLDRTWGDVRVKPFLGIDNLFNERYNASTLANAFGRRYYEPAPGREFYVGLTIETGAR